MWTRLTNENIEKILLGTLISHKNPNTINNNQLPLETIYKIEMINSDVIMKVNNLEKMSAIRTIDKAKLVLENWWAFLDN